MRKPECSGKLSALALLIAVNGCGGGGGGGTPLPNEAPVVSIETSFDASQPLMEFSTVTLTAKGSDPDETDASALKYTWEQLSGPVPTEISGLDGSVLTLTLPKVRETETLQFRVTVTDSEKAAGSAEIDFDAEEQEVLIYADYGHGANLWLKHPSAIDDVLIHSDPEAEIFHSPSVSPDRRWMALILNTLFDGPDEILLVSLDGRKLQRSAHQVSYFRFDAGNRDLSVRSIEWMSDSNGFVVHADARHPGVNELFFVPVGGKKEITAENRISADIVDANEDHVPDTGGVRDFWIGPAGNQVAYIGDINGDVAEVFVTAPGGKSRRVSPIGEDLDGDGLPGTDYSSPDWSFDGKYLAFGGDPDGSGEALFISDPAANEPARSISGDEISYWKGWSPVDHMLFVGAIFDGAKGVYMLDADEPDLGASRIRVSEHLMIDAVLDRSWSPGGKYIAFNAHVGEQQQLFSAVAVDPVTTVLGVSGSIVAGGNVASGQNVPGMIWSPDEKHVAFVGDLQRDNDDEIYVSDLMESGARRTVADIAGNDDCRIQSREIAWNRGGTHLLSACGDALGNDSYLRAFPVDGVGTPVNLSGEGMDVDGDGTGDGTIWNFLEGPSGSRILFYGFNFSPNDDNGRLYSVSLETPGKPQLVAEGDLSLVALTGPKGIVVSSE